MITSIRSINFINQTNNIKNKENSNHHNNIQNNYCDTISFSGKLINPKLSAKNRELVQDFAKKLQLNKIYKFSSKNSEKFQITSIASPENTQSRILILQYSGYSKDNMAKYLNCTIKDSGEVIESGEIVNSSKKIDVYEKVLPELINYASKQLKIKA